MRNRSLLRSIVIAALALLALAPHPARAAEPAPRQSETLPFDADTIDRSWFDLSMSYRKLEDSDTSRKGSDLVLDGRAAWSFTPSVELGVAGSYVSRDFDDRELGSPSGLGDTLGWAKYRFPGAGSAVFSVGGFASVPTGDEEDFLGTGNLEGGVFFSGGVRTRGDGFVQAHVGVRWNRDFDNRLVHLDAKNSILAGFGGVYEAASGIEVFSSLLLETSRYEGGDDTVRLTGGARWTLSTSWRVQVLASAGLTDAAPRLSLGAGVVWAR
ncbi:MAG: hypothetical protein LAO51_06185 [Acidobacteriia bacterium]|nr:hypothetical protein [Terriglobia bacterium]